MIFLIEAGIHFASASSILWLLPFIVLALHDASAGVPWNSISKWKIRLTGNPTASEQYAAIELQRFLNEAGQVKLQIQNELSEKGPAIFIGPDAVSMAEDMEFNMEDLGPEDFQISVDETGIFIAGGRPRGTLYGVYAFLEDALGIRFLTPDHTFIPHMDNQKAIPHMDKKFSPPFSFRWSRFGEILEDHLFATRMRTNTVQEEEKLGGKTPVKLINHTFGQLMPWSEYGDEHPEYYNEIDGKRPKNIWHDQYDPGVQLCTTNPDVIRIVTEKVLRKLEENPDLANISVSQNDNGQYCQCDRCRAIDEREGSHMGSLLTLVNVVADEVAKRYPGVMVGTLAYAYSRKPPKNIKPRPNVQIQLCSIECCQTHAIDDPDCPKNPPFCKDLKNWGKICDNVYVWDYVTNFHNYLLPCPNLRTLGNNVRFFHQNGVRGLHMQGPGPGAEMGGLRNYIISNLIWDPSKDDGVLMDEFLRLHYGKAAGLVMDYIDLIHDAAEENTQHRNCFGSASEHGLNADLGWKGLTIFRKAIDEADSRAIQERLEKASIGCHALIVESVVSQAFQKIRSRKKNRDKTPFVLDVQARKIRPYLGPFFDLCRKHDIPKMGEWATLDEVEEVVREGYKMEEGESF